MLSCFQASSMAILAPSSDAFKHGYLTPSSRREIYYCTMNEPLKTRTSTDGQTIVGSLFGSTHRLRRQVVRYPSTLCPNAMFAFPCSSQAPTSMNNAYVISSSRVRSVRTQYTEHTSALLYSWQQKWRWKDIPKDTLPTAYKYSFLYPQIAHFPIFVERLYRRGEGEVSWDLGKLTNGLGSV
jgi:hypothetical protein